MASGFHPIFTGFDFSDFLSLFLALFSITLAVLFYFKATDTSNTFYDNTYKFTNNVSEILGRVEEGFGARLKHLDEGYIRMQSAVERIPFDKKEAQKELEEEEKVVENVEKERNDMIEDLAKKAKLEEAEKSELFERLKIKDAELANAKEEIKRMKNKMIGANPNQRLRDPKDNNPDLMLFLKEFLYMSGFRNLNSKSKDIINREMHKFIKRVPVEVINEMVGFNILNKGYDITDIGIEILDRICKEEQ